MVVKLEPWVKMTIKTFFFSCQSLFYFVGKMCRISGISRFPSASLQFFNAAIILFLLPLVPFLSVCFAAECCKKNFHLLWIR